MTSIGTGLEQSASYGLPVLHVTDECSVKPHMEDAGFSGVSFQLAFGAVKRTASRMLTPLFASDGARGFLGVVSYRRHRLTGSHCQDLIKLVALAGRDLKSGDKRIEVETFRLPGGYVDAYTD